MANADVKVVIGVSKVETTNNIKQDLQAILSGLPQKSRQVTLYLNKSETQTNIKNGLKNIASKELKVTPTIKKFAASDAIKSLKSQITKELGKLKVGFLDQDSVTKAINKYKKSLETASGEATANIKTDSSSKQRTKEYTDEAKALDTLRNQLKAYNREITNSNVNKKDKEDSSITTEQLQQLETYQQKFDTLRSTVKGYISAGDQENAKATLSQLEQEVQGYKELTDSIKATAQATRDKKAEDAKETSNAQQEISDANRKNDLLRQGVTLQGQMNSALESYSKAQFGKSSSDYAAIEQQHTDLQKLIADCKNGTKSADEFEKEMKELQSQFATSKTNIQENGEATKTFGDRVNNLAQRFTSWFGVSQAIMLVTRGLREMIDTAIELDYAMGQLEIVTQATSSQLDKFYETTNKTAQAVGRSTTDLIESATTYARLGYSLDESSALAEYTAMLENVGDIDTSSAQDAITAMIKAFDVDADDLESVMDKLVVVGNSFPVSVSDLAEGINNAGSALSAAGNSLEESFALLTAANTTVNLCRVA